MAFRSRLVTYTLSVTLGESYLALDQCFQGHVIIPIFSVPIVKMTQFHVFTPMYGTCHGNVG
jgi:hypothetical protein